MNVLEQSGRICKFHNHEIQISIGLGYVYFNELGATYSPFSTITDRLSSFLRNCFILTEYPHVTALLKQLNAANPQSIEKKQRHCSKASKH
jgi:hypothetical protein